MTTQTNVNCLQTSDLNFGKIPFRFFSNPAEFLNVEVYVYNVSVNLYKPFHTSLNRVQFLIKELKRKFSKEPSLSERMFE